ncbi:MAG: hypothetical protein IPP14_07130 [Planctomycetes bacterium]|nr:hypothetical protein [Planctomycetota bacterium]
MDADAILRRLSEWKEKILFGGVLLASLFVARNASPFGSGVDTIDREARQSALSAAGVDEGVGMRALERLQKPPDVSPTPPEPKDITRLFYDERDTFASPPGKGSGWVRGQENFERLPPVQLSVPGFPALTDFDLPAGPMPGLSRARGMVPRDPRKVALSDTETGEFTD